MLKPRPDLKTLSETHRAFDLTELHPGMASFGWGTLDQVRRRLLGDRVDHDEPDGLLTHLVAVLWLDHLRVDLGESLVSNLGSGKLEKNESKGGRESRPRGPRK